METPWATAPLTLVLGDLMFGVRPATGQDLEDAGCRRSRRSSSLSSWCAGLLLLVLIGYVLVPSRFCVPERGGLARAGRARCGAFGRSRAICRGFGGELFMRWLGQIVLGLTFALCFQNGGGDAWARCWPAASSRGISRD